MKPRVDRLKVLAIMCEELCYAVYTLTVTAEDTSSLNPFNKLQDLRPLMTSLSPLKPNVQSDSLSYVIHDK